MNKPANDFEWCSEHWTGGHVCAEHRPGHTVHICCCGATAVALGERG